MTATFSNPQELIVQRRLTQAFILAAPTSLALIPIKREKSLTGGSREVDDVPRAVQTFKLIATADATDQITDNDANVEYGSYPYVLLGEWDAVIEEGDHWSDGGINYRVANPGTYNGYERRAFVIAYGG